MCQRMKDCELEIIIDNTNRSLQQTHVPIQPATPTPTPTPKPKEKKTKRKKKRGHGWSKRRKPTSSRSCEVVTKKPPTPTPTPKPKHKTKPKFKKKRGHGWSRSRKGTPSRSCEVETRYEFFQKSFPINSSRPATMKSIRVSESLGGAIFEMLISMNNGDFDQEIGPSRCSCRECPYITGDHRDQICLLMHRLHEVLCNN